MPVESNGAPGSGDGLRLPPWLSKALRGTASEVSLMRHNFRADFLASVVVFLVALPLCMGIAIASGVPPALGLISGIIGGLVVSILAGSPLLISGPAAGLAVIVWQLVNDHGLAALGPIVLFAGIFQMLAGGLRLGLWFRAVSPSVIHGMLAGIGVSIMATQLHVMIDKAPNGHGLKDLLLFPGQLLAIGEDLRGVPLADWLGPVGGSTHHLAFGVGVLTVLTIILWPRLAPKALRTVPAPLAGVLAAALVCWILALPIRYVSVPESLFAEIEVLSFEAVLNAFDSPLLGAALLVAFIASVETLLSASAVDKMHDGAPTNYDKELFAQGLGNALCGLVGALPLTGVIARSGANVASGGKTRASAFMHAVWLLLFAGALSFTLQRIPIAALAGVLIVIGFKLVNPAHIRQLGEYGRGEVIIYWITLSTIVVSNLFDGVLVGIILAFAKLLYSLLHLGISVRLDTDRKQAHLDLRGAATFIQLPKLAQTLDTQVPDSVELHVSIKHLTYIDHACLDLLENWALKHQDRGGRLVLEWDDLRDKYHRRASSALVVQSGETKPPVSSAASSEAPALSASPAGAPAAGQPV